MRQGKKVTVKKENEKNENNPSRKQGGILILAAASAVAIVLILVFSLREPPNEKEYGSTYNGYSFIKVPLSNTWNTSFPWVKGMNLSFEFYHHPQEVEKIPADAGIRAGFLGVRQQLGTFYIAFDPLLSNLGTTAIAGTEISRVTGKYFMVPTAAGFTEPLNASLSAGGYEFPIYNCGNANSTTFVLEMRPGSTNRIAYGNNCAVIYARSPNETILMADLFVYKLTGVIPDNQYDR